MSDQLILTRSAPLIDIDIKGGKNGREVSAYAATFGNRYEVTDRYGHYDEIIRATAFNRTLGRGIGRVVCIFNHGMDLAHQPSDRFAMPLGKPLEIRADSKGLVTRTRYAKTELADEVLELIRSGAITCQSFRGPAYESTPPRFDQNIGRSVVERVQVGLTDYGPGVLIVNDQAAITAVRTQSPAPTTNEQPAVPMQQGISTTTTTTTGPWPATTGHVDLANAGYIQQAPPPAPPSEDPASDPANDDPADPGAPTDDGGPSGDPESSLDINQAEVDLRRRRILKGTPNE